MMFRTSMAGDLDSMDLKVACLIYSLWPGYLMPQDHAPQLRPCGDMVATQIEGANPHRQEGDYLTDLSMKTGAGEGNGPIRAMILLIISLTIPRRFPHERAFRGGFQ